MNSFPAAPPDRQAAHRPRPLAQDISIEIDRIWQRGRPGQVLLLVSASSIVLTVGVLAAALAAAMGT